MLLPAMVDSNPCLIWKSKFSPSKFYAMFDGLIGKVNKYEEVRLELELLAI